MILYRGLRHKLAPTAEQDRQFRPFAAVCRQVYNLALEQRSIWWRQYHRHTGSRLGYAAQCRELTILRAEFDWIATVSQTCQQQADLDPAFDNFFEDRAQYPTPRRKGRNDAFRFQGREVEGRSLNARWSEVRSAKIGWVRVRKTRPPRSDVQNTAVSLSDAGWHISFACAIEHEVPINICPAVGVDRGIVNTLTLSTQEWVSIPERRKVLDRHKSRAQRILARRQPRSKRRVKQLRRVARKAAQIARIRQDWQHGVSIDIARRFGTVVLEDLKIAYMTVDKPRRNLRRKLGLNRNILAQGWNSFANKLSYKTEERGGRVDPAQTSQTCASRDVVDARSRESQAIFRCIKCGHRDPADVGAAKNILRRWNAAHVPVERSRGRLVEAGTTQARHPPLGNTRRSRQGRC
jgi:putative transposase